MTHRYALPGSRGHRRRAGLLALFTAASVATGLAVAASAAATGGLPSSTTLAVSPQSSTAGTPVTLTATIKVLGLDGLGITPTGTVTFTSKNLLGAVATLGTAPVGACFLTTCTATLTTSNVPVNTVSATANYSGDNLVAPSSGSHALTVTANSSPGSSSTVTCYSGQTCDTGTMTSSDNTTKLDVKADASSNTQTVSGSLTTGQTLHGCVEPPDAHEGSGDGDDDDGVFVGALGTFSSTATDAGKTVTVTGTGTTGAIMKHQFQEHPTHAGCYGAPHTFKGFVNGVYTNAVFNSTDGLYEAILATCTYAHNALPCMSGQAGPSGTTTYSYIVKAPPGDPKIIP
jgi:hypothetical protein